MCALSLSLCTCSNTGVMTRPRFHALELGTSAQTVQEECGPPYSIRKLPDGSEEYRYIERISADSDLVEENSYYVTIKNGRVISKRYDQERPPAYDEIYNDDPNHVPN